MSVARGALAIAGVMVLWALWLLVLGAPPIGPARPYPTALAALLFALAAIAFWRPGRLRLPTPTAQILLLALALAALGLPLAGLWAGGRGGENVVFGLWQASDAANYEAGALHLLWQGQLDSWNTRRPLMAVALASVFALSGASLMAAQMVFVALVAAAVTLAARAVWRTQGPGAGLLVLTTLLVFPSLHVGSFLSEMLGLPLGAFAFALLWAGLHDGRRGPVAVGLMVLALGLNARAGAFFVLPALVLWLAWRARADGRRAMLITAAWASGAVALGFVPARLLTAAFGAPEGIAFGNLAPTLYGLAVGGKGWLQVYADHPQIRDLPGEAAQFAEIYRLALAAFLAEPWRLLLGILRAYNDYLFNTGWVNFFRNPVIRALAIGLLLLGLVDCVRRRREAGAGFLLAVTAGVLLSVPILADGGARVFAATIPTTAALIAMGGVVVARRCGRDRPPLMPARASWAPEWALGAILLLLCGPLMAVAPRPAAPVAVPDCPTGQTAASFRARPGSAIFLVGDNDPRDGRARHVGVSAYSAHTGATPPAVASSLRVLLSRDDVSGRLAFVYLPVDAAPARLCGTWRDGAFLAAP